MKKTLKTLADHKALAPLATLDPLDPSYDLRLHTALSWLHQNIDGRSLRSEAMAYLKETRGEIANIQYVDDWRFNTLGKIAYLLNRGFQPAARTAAWVAGKLDALVAEAATASKPEPATPKSTEPEVDPAEDLLADIVALVETGGLTDQPDRPFAMLTAAGIKAAGVKKILAGLEQRCINISSKARKKDCAAAVQQVKNYLDNLKAAAKPRAAAAKNVDKAVAKALTNLEYQKEHGPLQIVSINPEQIIGAKALMVFNSKTRKVGLYLAAKDGGGLSVKGKSLEGYDETKSVQKTLRKPEEQLPVLRNAAGIRDLSKALEDIPTVHIPLSGRISGEILLVKAFR